jgi:hypothetical protein
MTEPALFSRPRRSWRLAFAALPRCFTICGPLSGTDEIKVRTIPGTHPMTVNLPDLGRRSSYGSFSSESTSYRVWRKRKTE